MRLFSMIAVAAFAATTASAQVAPSNVKHGSPTSVATKLVDAEVDFGGNLRVTTDTAVTEIVSYGPLCGPTKESAGSVTIDGFEFEVLRRRTNEFVLPINDQLETLTIDCPQPVFDIKVVDFAGSRSATLDVAGRTVRMAGFCEGSTASFAKNGIVTIERSLDQVRLSFASGHVVKTEIDCAKPATVVAAQPVNDRKDDVLALLRDQSSTGIWFADEGDLKWAQAHEDDLLKRLLNTRSRALSQRDVQGWNDKRCDGYDRLKKLITAGPVVKIVTDGRLIVTDTDFSVGTHVHKTCAPPKQSQPKPPVQKPTVTIGDQSKPQPNASATPSSSGSLQPQTAGGGLTVSN